MDKLYYKPPTDKIFNEVKEKSMEIWSTYSNEFGYADEKNNRIKDMTNIEDNVMFMVAMFDQNNQQKLFDKLSPEAEKAIKDRIKSVE